MPRFQATFDNAVPSMTDSQQPRRFRNSPFGKASVDETKPTVLFADDTPEILYDMVDLIEDWGFTVIAAHGGREAIDCAIAHKPEIIVSDISMPVVDGYEVARQIRAQPWGADVLMIAHSGIVSPDASKAALVAGFDYFVPKPADFDRLRNLLDSTAREK